jgi:hypothetical protein
MQNEVLSIRSFFIEKKHLVINQQGIILIQTFEGLNQIFFIAYKV